MRKNIKSLAPTLWLVIAAFIIAIFAVWGGAGRLQEARSATTLASVGKQKISSDLFFLNLRERLESLKMEYKDLDKNLIQQLNIPQQVLEQMIQQILLLQAAKSLDIKASDEEIQNRIKSYPVFQKDGKFMGFEEYKKILDWNHIPVSDFEESLRKEIVINKLLQVLTAGITATPEELWKNYKDGHESAKMEYAILETNKIELKEEPPLSEIKEYFEKNKDAYKTPEKREASIAFLKTDDLKNEIKLTESEIEKYYKDNLSQFQESEKVQVSRIYLPYENRAKELVLAEAKSILEKMRNGEAFAELAKNHSKDKKAAEGGDWGLYEWRTLPSEEQKEIERLSAGETSEAIELDDGLSILKVAEKKPPLTKSIEEVKEKIRSILEDQKAREIAEERISRLGKNARKEKSLVAAAQKDGVQVKSTGLLKEGQAIEDIDSAGTISTALFQLKEKEISSLLYTYKGAGIAQMEKIEPPRQANFEEVEEEAKEKFIALRKKEEALERIKKIKSELNKTSLEALAEKYGLEYKTADEHKQGQYLSTIGENTEIDKQAFSLPLNESSGPIEFEGGYALIKILDRKTVTREDFEKDRKTEEDNLLEAKKNKFLHSFMMKLRKERGVKIKYDLFLKIVSDVLSRYEGEK